jgi:hypothetical protein
MMMKEDGARMMIPKRRSLFVAGHEREREEKRRDGEGVREAGRQRR